MQPSLLAETDRDVKDVREEQRGAQMERMNHQGQLT